MAATAEMVAVTAAVTAAEMVAEMVAATAGAMVARAPEAFRVFN
jgi:hypothetical protein